MTPTLPSLYVPHGAPTFTLRPGAAGAALADQAKRLPRPRAIVVVSPHWDTPTPRVGSAAKPETIHDFWGFPDELYAIRYPATGCPEVAREVVQALNAASLPAELDAERGLDHGAWVPLRMMYPDADVPVVPLSLSSAGGPELAYRMGLALAPLRQQGLLILGTGSLTHNLRDFQLAWHNGGQTPAYVRRFADWINGQLSRNDLPALLDYRRLAPEAPRAHPSEEHLLPLYVALGAAGAQASAQRFHAGIDDYVIAMDAYAFTAAQ